MNTFTENINSNDLNVISNLVLTEMYNGNLKKGFEYINKIRSIHSNGFYDHNQKEWKGESLKEKTLIFRMEGWLGDQILNFRFVNNFKNMGANIIIYCDPDLIDLFSRHGFVCISDDIPLEWYFNIKYDYLVYSTSAPYYLNMEYNELDGSSYIFTSKQKIHNIKLKKLKIGLRWAGRNIPEEINRRIPSELMISLHNIENIEFCSLQRDDGCVDNLPFADMRDEMKTIEDTVNIISELDLVITSCTSIAHLSAAMGKPTWILTPIVPYYTWAVPGKKTRWYDSVTLFRQEKYGEWQQPIDKIRQELINLTKNKK